MSVGSGSIKRAAKTAIKTAPAKETVKAETKTAPAKETVKKTAAKNTSAKKPAAPKAAPAPKKVEKVTTIYELGQELPIYLM